MLLVPLVAELKIMTIDSHHHFWNYNPAEYGWIGEDMAGIRRDFMPADLKSALDSAGIDGAVSVQARQTLPETRWLLSLAEQHPWLCGVVGWLPLCEPNLGAALDELAGHPKLKAVRHLVQGEPDGYSERADYNAGIRALKSYDLVYDVMVVERQLPQAIAFVDRHPGQSFVVDHLAKPRIKAGDLEPWATHFRELARRENVVCKISGMATEADFQSWTSDDLRPYFEVALEAFGPSRLMYGSDWPVCLAATDYKRWAETVRDWTRGFSESENAAFWGGTATRVYGL